MKPETYKLWEEALRQIGRSEGLLSDKKFEDAKREATLSVLSACLAIDELSKELNIPDLSVIAKDVRSELCERILTGKEHNQDEIIEWVRNLYLGKTPSLGRNYTPREIIEWARRNLKWLSSELPPDTFPPLR